MAKVSIQVEVDEKWVDLVVKHGDLFQHSYCGYWAFGLQQDRKRGQIIRDTQTSPFPYGDTEASDARDFVAIERWLAKKPSVEPYYYWDRALAKRAFGEGVRIWGQHWFKDARADAHRYDVVIQQALFGQQRYSY